MFLPLSHALASDDYFIQKWYLTVVLICIFKKLVQLAIISFLLSICSFLS